MGRHGHVLRETTSQTRCDTQHCVHWRRKPWWETGWKEKLGHLRPGPLHVWRHSQTKHGIKWISITLNGGK